MASVVCAAVIPSLLMEQKAMAANDPWCSSQLEGMICDWIAFGYFLRLAVEVIVLCSISPGSQTRDIGRLRATVGPLRLDPVHLYWVLL